MTETDLWGAEGFELSDEEDDVAVARAARIAASKKASSGYQAKIEEPGVCRSPALAADQLPTDALHRTVVPLTFDLVQHEQRNNTCFDAS